MTKLDINYEHFEITEQLDMNYGRFEISQHFDSYTYKCTFKILYSLV